MACATIAVATTAIAGGPANPFELTAAPANIIGVDVAGLPPSGPAYDRVVALAAQTATLDLADNTGPGNDVLLAKAILGDKDGVLAMIRGARNRDIAAQLVISERTAEWHVANVLSKLELESRAQLAHWFGGASHGV